MLMPLLLFLMHLSISIMYHRFQMILARGDCSIISSIWMRFHEALSNQRMRLAASPLKIEMRMGCEALFSQKFMKFENDLKCNCIIRSSSDYIPVQLFIKRYSDMQISFQFSTLNESYSSISKSRKTEISHLRFVSFSFAANISKFVCQNIE